MSCLTLQQVTVYDLFAEGDEAPHMEMWETPTQRRVQLVKDKRGYRHPDRPQLRYKGTMAIREGQDAICYRPGNKFEDWERCWVYSSGVWRRQA